MDWISLIKIILIGLALPTQYFLSKYWSNDDIQQNLAFQNVVETLNEFKKSYFELESWKKWYFSFVIDIPVVLNKNLNTKKDNLAEDTDIALEVLEYRKKIIDFAESSVIRSPRPSNVQYRVGQVVKHKKIDFFGVIIGWDVSAQAPESWLDRHYDTSEKEYFVNQPHYLLLVDAKYQNDFKTKAYIAQEDLEVIVNSPVTHQILNIFFSKYDGGQYLKKKYLQTVYPHD